MSLDVKGSWTPILEGKQKDQALAAVMEIASALTLESSKAAGDGPDALAQHALFQAYVTAEQNDPSRMEAVSALLEEAITGLSQRPMRPGLYGGFTNVAWVVEHLQHYPLAAAAEEATEDANEEIDQALLAYLTKDTWQEAYDLTGGLVGFGVYALERFPKPVAIQCVERILDHLSALASQKDGGVTWWTPPEMVATVTKEDWKEGQYNLGVAHGIPGIIAILAEVHSRKIFQEKTRLLLSGAVTWLLNQRLPEDAGSWFPHALGGPGSTKGSRAAWCYGDPGVAVTLLLAARSCPSLNLEDTAVRIASQVARRDPSKCGVMDAGLCHGSAGLAHLYNRVFQATRATVFKDAARFWFGRTFEMRKAGTGVAGFSPYFPREEPSYRVQAERGFLMGAGGIGLALLAAISSIEPLWDRLLLAAVPPAPETPPPEAA